MSVGLVERRFQEDLFQVMVCRAAPHRAFQVFFLIREQAGPQVPLGSEAQPVARVTEMMGQRAYEADFSRRSLKFKTLCRTVKIGLGDVDEFSQSFNLRLDKRIWYEMRKNIRT